jgi:phosphate transport system permease protein
VSKNGAVSNIDITDKESPTFIERLRLVPGDAKLTSIRFLTGDISLLVGDSLGNISQWSLIRQPDNIYRLTEIRKFNQNTIAITSIAPELTRKGFIATDVNGQIGIYHTTAHRQLILESSKMGAITHSAISPRANAMLLEDANGQYGFWQIENEHPEVSWSSLWGKVWYENYSEPDYIWQSSSASDDFEPKYSLVPLTFGTIKAAFYAMLLGVPLALCGALYTAQFMSPKMRSAVKPSIEIMEALPTVILGFLAGLWLAPFVETHLPGIFAILVVLPIGIVLTAYLWEKLPESIRLRVPDGWEAGLLLPVVISIIWISILVSPGLENFFFGGDIRNWLTNEMGVGFDQRNAIVVGLAMGFAVIPIVFSIAEDAVFGVPKHLIQGSLALGATPWQTMIRVVLLTASPGIFSAIMIGLGRAVGETMIVLMATGNTPVMDFSPFQGLRTLSANIAVELPESEVNSTHFRVLFLAGLVLFLFTFFVNTLAELVRQRLRKKYSTL